MNNKYTLVLKKAIALILILFLHFALAQDSGQNLSQRINALSQSLSNIEKQIKPPVADADVNSLLNAIPVTSSSIDSDLDNLYRGQSISQSDINHAENQMTALKKIQESLKNYASLLDTQNNALMQLDIELKSLQQLLSNPVNQASISEEDAKKLNIAEQTQTSLNERINNLKTQTQTQLNQIDDTMGPLNRFIAALLAELSQQQTAQQDDSELKRLAEQQKQTENAAANLKSELNSRRSSMTLSEIETMQQQIFQQRTEAWLLSIDMQIMQVMGSDGFALPSRNELASMPVNKMEAKLADINQSLKTLDALKAQLDEREAEINKRNEIIGEQPELTQALKKRQNTIAYQRLILQAYPAQLTQAITAEQQKDLFSRSSAYQKGYFVSIKENFLSSLLQISYQIQISFKALYKNIKANPLILLATAIASSLWFLFLHLMRRGVSYISKNNRHTTLAYLLRRFDHLISRNIYMLLIMSSLLFLLDAGNIGYPGDWILGTLISVIFSILLWLKLMRIEVRMSRISKKTAISSSLALVLLDSFTLLYVLAKSSSVTPAVISIFEKCLMLSLALFTWIIRRNLIGYLVKQKDNIDAHLYHLTLQLVRILPSLIFLVCVMNLLGYDNLSWLTLRYLGIGFLYLSLLAGGLTFINFVRKRAKQYSLRHFIHGIFIANDIVMPLSNVSKWLWLWFITAWFFKLLGWNANSYLIAIFLQIVQYPVISIGSSPITLQVTALLVFAIYLIFRLGQWLKTFSYHWFFAKISDFGVRNSLSIFSQYVVVFLGMLITLNVLGIDLTSLAVFAGALGVGVGLGLQDIAKNFISGILLLIERPLRSGDWIVIDGNEGTVKSIGMRAITIETFDKQEVIIPNASAISNSFVNNTHSSSILRTILYIGADYGSAPPKVLAVLREILEKVDGVLSDPKPLVVLWDYADSSVTYRVQYYINIDTHNILITRDAVLNAVWNDFNDNGIEIPFPQQDIHVKSGLLLPSPAPLASETA